MNILTSENVQDGSDDKTAEKCEWWWMVPNSIAPFWEETKKIMTTGQKKKNKKNENENEIVK